MRRSKTEATTHMENENEDDDVASVFSMAESAIEAVSDRIYLSKS